MWNHSNDLLLWFPKTKNTQNNSASIEGKGGIFYIMAIFLPQIIPSKLSGKDVVFIRFIKAVRKQRRGNIASRYAAKH